MKQARSCTHPGPCDLDVSELAAVPEVAAQLAQWDADTLSMVLRDYGAWDAAELADHAQNVQRMLWLAAGDIADGNA